MRFCLALAVILTAPPAWSWDFRPDPICTLSNTTDQVDLAVTFDPASGEYAIRIHLTAGRWPTEEVFGIRFEGPAPNLIVTDRHRVSEDNRTLTVTDRGFGNVLNGLQFNHRAVALTGDLAVAVDLDGVEPAVDAFRRCPEVPTS